jgi:hypothetical protein
MAGIRTPVGATDLLSADAATNKPAEFNAEATRRFAKLKISSNFDYLTGIVEEAEFQPQYFEWISLLAEREDSDPLADLVESLISCPFLTPAFCLMPGRYTPGSRGRAMS